MGYDRDYDTLAADIAKSEGNGDLAHALHQLSQVKAKLAEADERIAWLDCGFEQAMADTRAAEQLFAKLEAALPAVYRLALEAAASRFDEIAQHDQGGIDYSDLVGIPISNREQLVKSVKDAEMDAKDIRALPTPTAAELMARIQTGEKE